MVVALLLLLLVPLRSLTRAPEAVAPAPARAAAETRSVQLTLVATARPVTFSVTHLGREIWKGEAAGQPVETTLDLPWPAEGVDLGVSATWPGGVTGALKLEATPEGDEPQTRTAWGDGAVEETFTYR